MNVLVVALNHCHLGYLGCYGNQWIQTPALDRLATESLVFDQFYAVDVSAFPTHRACWSGRYRFTPARSTADLADALLAERLRDAGVLTALITDSVTLSHSPSEVRGFADVVDLGTPSPTEGPVDFAVPVGAATEWLDGHREAGPFLLWLDADALRPPWTPPTSYVDLYADDNVQGAPEIEADDELGADEVEVAQYCYAAQVTYVDDCIGKLLHCICERGYANNTAIMFFCHRGIPLGEHGMIGLESPNPYEECVHVPLLLRMPDGRGAATRTAALVQPVDLAPTILALFDVTPACTLHGTSVLPLLERPGDTVRDVAATAVSSEARSLHTAGWHLVTPGESGAGVSGSVTEPSQPHPLPELYLKPEDRWDQHNVAAQFPDEVERLAGVLEQFAEAVADDCIDDARSLPVSKPVPDHDTDPA